MDGDNLLFTRKLVVWPPWLLFCSSVILDITRLLGDNFPVVFFPEVGVGGLPCPATGLLLVELLGLLSIEESLWLYSLFSDWGEKMLKGNFVGRISSFCSKSVFASLVFALAFLLSEFFILSSSFMDFCSTAGHARSDGRTKLPGGFAVLLGKLL